MDESIYLLQLHDSLRLPEDSDIQVTRVPGGWIYRYTHHSNNSNTHSESMVFVPFNLDFRDDEINRIINERK